MKSRQLAGASNSLITAGIMSGDKEKCSEDLIIICQTEFDLEQILMKMVE
jgi:hypothetical protein